MIYRSIGPVHNRPLIILTTSDDRILESADQRAESESSEENLVGSTEQDAAT